MPYIVYEAESDSSAQNIADSLQRFVGRASWLGIPPRDSVPFFGTVTSTGFRIMRVVRGRDSLNPVMYGRFSPSGLNTRVRVVLTLHPLVWGFLAIWSVFTGHLVLAGLRNHDASDFYGGLGFFLFAWLMTVLVFYYDAAKSKRLLRESLHLQDVA
jgi:hypothetical protein